MDSEGHHFLVLEKISNQWSDGKAIALSDWFIIILGGTKHTKKTTHGWELITQMKDCFSKLVTMKDIKEINPFKLSKYAAGKN